MERVKTGLEVFLNDEKNNNKRYGLLCNPASVTNDYVHARIAIEKAFPGTLKALFSPQHGFFAEKQDNMIESGHIKDKDLNIPVYSLYGDTRIPENFMFDDIDTLLVDIQDVGTRVYTFIYTISFCMEKAAELNRKVIILDRPNPVNGIKTEGNLTEDEYRSFVGRFSVPMRHGLTVGEIATLFNKEFKIDCDLEVLPMEGWERWMHYKDTGLNWVLPSPNMPTPDTADVYPGQVIWEGTNISEGRGTTRPFELFGSPFLDTDKILKDIGDLEGVYLRKTVFEPTSNKWEGERCFGFQIHITDYSKYNSYETSIAVLKSIIKNHPKEFSWTDPPYEYEYVKKPIDMIFGSKKLREMIEDKNLKVGSVFNYYKNDLAKYNELKKIYHIY